MGMASRRRESIGKNTLEGKGGRKEGEKAEGWKVDIRGGRG